MPFFFFFLLEEMSAISSVFAGALDALALDVPPLASSLVCCKGGSALGSGATLGFNSLGSATAGFASTVAESGTTTEESERGGSWFGAAVTPVVCTLTALSPPIAALVICFTTAVAVTGSGSTIVGSPTCEALVTS